MQAHSQPGSQATAARRPQRRGCLGPLGQLSGPPGGWSHDTPPPIMRRDVPVKPVRSSFPIALSPRRVCHPWLYVARLLFSCTCRRLKPTAELASGPVGARPSCGSGPSVVPLLLSPRSVLYTHVTSRHTQGRGALTCPKSRMAPSSPLLRSLCLSPCGLQPVSRAPDRTRADHLTSVRQPDRTSR